MGYETFDLANFLPPGSILGFRPDFDFAELLNRFNNSMLARRVFDLYGISAAACIRLAANTAGVTAEWLAVRLQCEQGLIHGPRSADPSRDQLDWCLGFGKLDDGTVLEHFRGFAVQVGAAADGTVKIADKVKAYLGRPYTLDAAVEADRLTVTSTSLESLIALEYTPHEDAARLTQSVMRSFFPYLFAGDTKAA